MTVQQGPATDRLSVRADEQLFDPVQAAADDAGPRFPELARKIKDAGLLDLRPVRYSFLIAANAVMFGAGITAFVLIGNSWWQLLTAAYLAFCFGQIGFLWHDAAHKAMFRNKLAATTVGFVAGNLIDGISYGWWVGHHNRHHSHPNHLELDPDVGRRTIIFDMSQYPSRSRRQKFIVRYQHVLFFVLLTYEGIKLHKTALLWLIKGQPKYRKTEFSLLLLNFAVFLTGVFEVLSPLKALAFIAVNQGLFGVYVGMCFAPNHKGMETRTDEESLTWLERQILTSRNIRPNPLIDFLYGGLNYQVEHHLFPAMPRMNLGKCRVIVKEYCATHDIPYHEVGFAQSYREVAQFLYEVSEPVRAA